MYSVHDLIGEEPPAILLIDNFHDHDLRPDDVWLFTAPAAKATYARLGLLPQLEEDIRTYAMFNGRWSADEIEYQREIYRLLNAKVLVPRAAFGHASPHPVIYQAVTEEVLRIYDENFYFGSRDEIVFEPWPARLSCPGLRGPLRIGRLDTTTRYSLCCQEFPQLEGLSAKQLAVLHHIAYYSKQVRV